MKVDHDREKKTVTLSQGAFARKLLKMFSLDESCRSAKTPLPHDPIFRKFDKPFSVSDQKRSNGEDRIINGNR